MSDSITVKLKINSAHKLIKRSILKNPNPFAQVIYNNHSFCTNAQEKTTNPAWNKSFHIELHSTKDKLELIIWNQRLYDQKKSSAFLGSVVLTADMIDRGERRLQLTRNNPFPSKPVRGFVKVEMIKIDSHSIPTNLSMPQVINSNGNQRGLLTENSQQSLRYSGNNQPSQRSNKEHSYSNDDNNNSSRAGPSQLGHGDSLLPSNFERKVSDGGKVYFVDNNTSVIHWYHPAVPKCLRKIGDFSFLGTLPPGWDSLQSDSGRVYFIDHISRTTQYSDPRLLRALEAADGYATVIRKLQNSGTATRNQNGIYTKIERSRSDRRRSNGTQIEINQTGVTFNLLESSAEINNHLTNHNTEAIQTNRRSQSSGQLPSLNNQSVLDMELSMTNISEDKNIDCNNELAPLPLQRRRIGRPTSNYILMNKNSIEVKLRDLRSKLKELMQKKLCIIETSRDNILEESFRNISRLKPPDLRKRLVLKFTDEEGLDYGGVAREWLYLLSETLFSCRHGLFETNGDNDGNLLRVSPLCIVNEDHLHYFHFIGRVIGMAIFHGYYIDADFCKIFYKSILNKQPKLEDFEELDKSIYNSLVWMRDNNIDDADLSLTFSIEQEVFGQLQLIDLCENGRFIPVMDNAKTHYIERYVDYNLSEKCAEQYEQIKKGIYEVLPQQILDNLNEDEFEVLLTGISEIKIEDWQKNTRLKHCSENEPLIKWFWEVVTSYTEQQRTKLLQFVTGSSRIPLSGFEGLRGSYGSDEPKLFTIKVIRNANPQSLPKAHTWCSAMGIQLARRVTQRLDEILIIFDWTNVEVKCTEGIIKRATPLV